jgi:hypothetical protein
MGRKLPLYLLNAQPTNSHLLAKLAGCHFIDEMGRGINDDAIAKSSRFDRLFLLHDIIKDKIGFAFERIAISSSSGALMSKYVALP